jgi:hypothetical protein
MGITETAREFFDACESGQGSISCAPYCHDDATFSCQADARAEIVTLASYNDWMRDLIIAVPDGHYELKSFSTDEERSMVTAFGIFKGTDTGPGAADPTTSNSLVADYVYAMEFDGDRIRHMTKIWNDSYTLGA